MNNKVNMNMGNVGAYGKLFTIPQDPADREFLLAVDRRARSDINRKYGILLDYDWQANTIANSLIETIIADLSFRMKNGERRGIGIRFYDIITAVVSIKKNADAEKEGNINIFFEPGERANELIANGPDTEEYTEKISPENKFLTGDPEDDDIYKNLEYHARYKLSSVNGVMMPEHLRFAVFAIGYTFLESLYLEILYRLSNMDNNDPTEEKLVTVNFNDNIEIHGSMKNNEVKIFMRPGLNAKLLIKSDEFTEDTMGDFSED